MVDYIKEMVLEQVQGLKTMMKNPRMAAFSVMNLAMIVFSALMIWKGLMAVTGSDSPVVVVLSGSMEPAFQRGDILLLDNNKQDIHVGDIVVFKIQGRDIPIVHRVLRMHTHRDAKGVTSVDYLTKGDNNNIDDRNLYAPGQMWLSRSEIIGRAHASVPYVGMVTILLNDYPWLKITLVGFMGLFVLTGKET